MSKTNEYTRILVKFILFHIGNHPHLSVVLVTFSRLNWTELDWTGLYCTVLYCTVRYGTVR
jgi:hypothetical protein